MNRVIRTVTAIVLSIAVLFSVTACQSPTESADTTSGVATEATQDTETSTPRNGKFKVGIVQYVENGAFDAMRQGFIDALRASGYSEEELEIVYENAQSDPSNLNTIVRSMNDGSFDLVATIATPPSQAFVNLRSETPTVFIAMSDPVGAGVLTRLEKPDKHATGTSNPIPVDMIFNLAADLTPDAKHWGLLYSTNEDNAINTIKAAKAFLDKNNKTHQEGTVSNASEVQQVVEAMLPEVDAIYVPNDSTIQNAMPVVIEAATKAGVPVYGSSAVMTASGALGSVAISDEEIGEISAGMAIRILKGVDPSELPVQVVEGKVIDLNATTADALGVEIPEELAANAVIHE